MKRDAGPRRNTKCLGTELSIAVNYTSRRGHEALGIQYATAHDRSWLHMRIPIPSTVLHRYSSNLHDWSRVNLVRTGQKPCITFESKQGNNARASGVHEMAHDRVNYRELITKLTIQ